eukprot:4628036-Heterocapsa_arctica.AAC.1
MPNLSKALLWSASSTAGQLSMSGFACLAQKACTAASAGPSTVLHSDPRAPVLGVVWPARCRYAS